MICWLLGAVTKIGVIVFLVWFAYQLGDKAVDRAIVIDRAIYMGTDI